MFSNAVLKESCYRSVILKYLPFADHPTTAKEAPKDPASFLWLKKKCLARTHQQRDADLMRQPRGLTSKM